ncbi:TPA: hypothetical protein ACIVOM_003621 [Salmonella enterica subsp. enterica serovar Virchow]
MYKPSVNSLIEIIRKAQADNAELTGAINIYGAAENHSLAVIRALVDAKELNRRFINAMFSDITDHSELITDEQLNQIAELQQVHRDQYPTTEGSNGYTVSA